MDGARELKSIVRTMKAMAASNIGQYERARESLEDYYQTIAFGLRACFDQDQGATWNKWEYRKGPGHSGDSVFAILFGSDQAFVGQFNDTLTQHAQRALASLGEKKVIWTVGTRLPLLAADYGLEVSQQFSLPNSIHAITPLIESILLALEAAYEKGELGEFHIFHNQVTPQSGYGPQSHRLLPLDQRWRSEFADHPWPSKKIPQLIGERAGVLEGLIREYLFTTLFKACVDSLVSENYSRLSAMQRAEKNIEELLVDIGLSYHRLRQSSIDEELFDVVSGFEAQKTGRK